MNVLRQYPPNYNEICKVFPVVRTTRGIIFTYGDTIYNPDNAQLPFHLKVHEHTHSYQQDEIGIDAWWLNYLTSAGFRFEQELAAYRAQYMAMNRQEKRRWLDKIARDLSGAMYGNLCTFSEAKSLITMPVEAPGKPAQALQEEIGT